MAAEWARGHSVDVADELLLEQLLDQPSLAGLAQLISIKLSGSEGKSRKDLAMLQQLSRRLVAERPGYRCGHCGFAGKFLHWHCPGCQQWGSIKPFDGQGV
jgi:lipopolysaccharide biosynthesis regulator YciM